MKKEIKKIVLLNKKEGETPLEALSNFRAKNKSYENVPMTYAGRLDPMASGLLIVLAGEETKKKEKYLALPKEYEFEILFGFATDTYDILGKIINYQKSIINEDVENWKLKIENSLSDFTGKWRQKYPAYSSRTVAGKPLFAYARAGEEVEVPEREVFVKSLKLLKIKKISREKLLENIEKRIKKVKGDFRVIEITKIWRKNCKRGQSSYLIAGFKIQCGSGTYVRGIANSLGEKIGIPALAYSIKRTKIGKWSNI